MIALFSIVLVGVSMIETNTQQQPQQDAASTQQSFPKHESELETGQRATCAVCDAVYAPSSIRLPSLQNAGETLDAAFMSMCHFCFRCRRAACPQCWDEVHGVCGACVQEAHLTFRTAVPALDGLLFPPKPKRSPLQKQQTKDLFVVIRPGRFYSETQATQNIDSIPHVQPIIIEQTGTSSGEAATVGEESSLPAASPAKSLLPDFLEDEPEQESAPPAGKKGEKASRLERTLTWIVLIVLLVIVALMALAEYSPAVNTLIARLAHIDIH